MKMIPEESREELAERYEKAAQEYFREHMDGPAPPETATQGTQRHITLASLDLLTAARSDVHVFNELLVRFPRAGEVVPDNMVVVHDGPLEVDDVYDITAQPTRPFWMLDYISDNYPRKSYHKNFDKYERLLKVRYCLTFKTEFRELALYRHNGREYIRVEANDNGRFAIPELELEVALREGWVRFWRRGDLLLLPAEMQQQIDETRRQLVEERARLAAAQELERLRAENEQLKRRRNHK
jgi:hypothetical protein